VNGVIFPVLLYGVPAKQTRYPPSVAHFHVCDCPVYLPLRSRPSLCPELIRSSTVSLFPIAVHYRFRVIVLTVVAILTGVLVDFVFFPVVLHS
jgi:hypothetical protein